MIVNPLRSGRQVGGRASGVEVIINVEANRVRFPLDGEYMEVIGEGLVAGKSAGCADALRPRISRTMNSAVDKRRLFADVFHDVDFAAAGPACFVDIVA